MKGGKKKRGSLPILGTDSVHASPPPPSSSPPPPARRRRRLLDPADASISASVSGRDTAEEHDHHHHQQQQQPQRQSASAADEKEQDGEGNQVDDDREDEDGEGEGEENDDDQLGVEEGGEEAQVEGERPKLAEGYYEIEAIRKKRVRKGQVQYLIRWRGWPETANTWEPLENLVSISDVVDAFEESLRTGKRRLTRRRKRKHGSTHSQTKKKQQQQCSPAAATYNVPAVKIKIIEEPLSLPSLNNPRVTEHVDMNVSRENAIETAKKTDENDLGLPSSYVDDRTEQNTIDLNLNELMGTMATSGKTMDKNSVYRQESQMSSGDCQNETDLNLNELIGAMATSGNTMEKNSVHCQASQMSSGDYQNEMDLNLNELTGTMATSWNTTDKNSVHHQESQMSSGEGLLNGLLKADDAEPVQSVRCSGAKRRKSGSVKRFKKDSGSRVTGDVEPLAITNFSDTYAADGQQGNDLACKSKCDESKDIYMITEIIKPISYSSSMSNNVHDVSITFKAKSSDGKEVMVDNRYLKANNPLLLIDFYEQRLRYNPI